MNGNCYSSGTAIPTAQAKSSGWPLRAASHTAHRTLSPPQGHQHQSTPQIRPLLSTSTTWSKTRLDPLAAAPLTMLLPSPPSIRQCAILPKHRLQLVWPKPSVVSQLTERNIQGPDKPLRPHTIPRSCPLPWLTTVPSTGQAQSVATWCGGPRPPPHQHCFLTSLRSLLECPLVKGVPLASWKPAPCDPPPAWPSTGDTLHRWWLTSTPAEKQGLGCLPCYIPMRGTVAAQSRASVSVAVIPELRDSKPHNTVRSLFLPPLDS